ncbi:c-type cytochrome biogenesis protein CcmI [Moraxella catarrhalis]|uniref:Cytochrome c heme lyase subunit CcmH n=1 Tax=Moraxella catarrhalis TaxID=480 RepID=A0A198UGB1_MORCA|nr:c-type cytochrome biogenesis protein CcmI [Moraxella catarrhalis]OAU95009.1 Cytochrome c heme lyase subunit CcmH [Moraxella catarrhalis]OAU95385.1 Cytochrome c heme lyase subunit CcmH [Moraxella catarrhalis]OAU98233.1 Cytochrome c heme lyase subunit CcmH [Moraxella catarrhalis]
MTPSLILFFSLCAVLTVLLSLVVILPWRKVGVSSDNQLMAINVQIFGERIAELDADKAAGVIDEASYQTQITELKRQLIDAQTTTEAQTPVGIKGRAIIIIWIPILVVIAYVMTADRTAVFTLWQAQDKVGQVADDLLTGKIDVPPEWAAKESTALISAMQTNVHRHADDANRWMRLSELFMMLEAQPQALEALARANRLQPDNEEIALTYAQTNFFINEGRMDATTHKILTKILTQTPNHEGAMMMMAMGEVRAGNYPEAKAWIARLRSGIAARSGDHSEALASLDKLVENIDNQQAAAAQGVTVGVSLSPALVDQLRPDDVLFVSIGEQAGGAPYAVKRLPASELMSQSVSVKLSDMDAMMPTRTLSAGRDAGAVLVVNARISHSGNAVSESGDLAANPIVLDKQTEVSLTISQIVP